MQDQRLRLSQSMVQKMSPQLIQSVRLMAMPIQDLRQTIAEEIDKNPALEIARDKTTLSLDEVISGEGYNLNNPLEPLPMADCFGSGQSNSSDSFQDSSKSEKEAKSAEAMEPSEKDAIQTEPIDYSLFENSSDAGFIKTRNESYNSLSDDTKRKFIEGAFSREKSLSDHLLEQLIYLDLSPYERSLGEKLILNLDKNGFHLEDPFSFTTPENHHTIENVMHLIQEFDPPGICVKDHIESLIVQADLRLDAPFYIETVLTDLLALLEKKKYNQIIKELKISKEEWERGFSFLKSLNPFPASGFGEDCQSLYIYPDLVVRKKEGELVITLNDNDIPELQVNPYFQAIQDKKIEGVDKNSLQFTKKGIKDARWFIGSLAQRNSTLLKTGWAILNYQGEFFRKGPKFLKPLNLKQIAEEISVHETTVSRITTNKYIETDWGIFELKYFFTNAVSNIDASGASFSKQGVKELIKEIVEGYDGEKKLSDQKISDLLMTKGVKIARRTVAKYRKELAIDSSFGR